MTTAHETILLEVESRLTTPSDFVSGTYGTRRGHLVPIPRERAPASHIVGGDDRRKQGSKCEREFIFTVAIYTRGDDDASKSADALIAELYARLEPGWDRGISISPGAISYETETADTDASRVDCQFRASYATLGEWSLELAGG